MARTAATHTHTHKHTHTQTHKHTHIQGATHTLTSARQDETPLPGILAQRVCELHVNGTPLALLRSILVFPVWQSVTRLFTKEQLHVRLQEILENQCPRTFAI